MTTTSLPSQAPMMTAIIVVGAERAVRRTETTVVPEKISAMPTPSSAPQTPAMPSTR